MPPDELRRAKKESGSKLPPSQPEDTVPHVRISEIH
jgi:hypothetical protein